MTTPMYRALLATTASLAIALSLSAPVRAADPVNLSFLIEGGDEDSMADAQALVDAFTAKNPGIHVDIETRPGGGEGDNLIKTRLATGEMTDVFVYNSGSLFQAMNPVQNLLDLTNEPFQKDVLGSFKQVVTGSDGHVYGAPMGTARGGGILYNKKIYADLGLSIPKSWAEFMANNEKIKAAGKAPVIQTFGDSWTSQLFVLADYYNVAAADPAFAQDYTANKAKYASTPAAMRGFQDQEDVFKAGDLNADYASAKAEDGWRMIAMGEGAHYPMLTSAAGGIAENYPDQQKDVGFFPLPGQDGAKNGVTVWMPDSLYVARTSKHPAEAKAFVAFVESPAGCDVESKLTVPTGPYLIKGCDLPANVTSIVSDLLPYFKADGLTAPALEFLSPIKGPSLEQITVEVGSGIRSAADGAALYDQDVKKQAQQLGIAGW